MRLLWRLAPRRGRKNAVPAWSNGESHATSQWIAGTHLNGTMLQSKQGQSERAKPPGLDAGRHDYLAFVDGLRAVSILAVVGFHIGVAGFPGGYVGVDVFFVISGFLIINQIKDGLEAGRFSLTGFFARRALRILPPFLAILLVTLAIAPFVLTTPAVYYDYMRQAAISPLMLANFLFYRQHGYFDLHADQKPLLHTWTLSIEEQFYLLAPLTLLLLFRVGQKRFGTFALAAALALAIASFLGAVSYTTAGGQNPAFYFPHWRAWEFIVGGLITRGLAAAVARGPRWTVEALGMAGLALIVIAVIMLDGKTPFPSWRAAIPVAGAVFVIVAGLARPDILVARLLSLRWMVGIGLVSYAWYLWHWPILSYLRILRLGDPSLIPDLLGGGVLAFALACLSYRYIEQPIRNWRRSVGSAMPAGRIVVAGMAGCLALAGLGLATGYAGYRYTLAHTETRYKTEASDERSFDCIIFGAGDIRDSCFDGTYGLLVGDSHAQVLAESFTRDFKQMGVRLVTLARPACPPLGFSPQERKRRDHGCRVFLEAYEKILTKPPKFVIFASLWPVTPSVQQMSDLIAEFSPQTRIVLMGPVPTFRYSALDCVALSDRYSGDRSRCQRSRADLNNARAGLTTVLKETAAKFGNVRYIDPTGLFCDATTCSPFDGDQVYFSDYSHVFPPGARRIFSAFRPDFEWAAANL